MGIGTVQAMQFEKRFRYIPIAKLLRTERTPFFAQLLRAHKQKKDEQFGSSKSLLVAGLEV